MDNKPRSGECEYCGRMSVRLLDPPLVEIFVPDHIAYHLVEGDDIWDDFGSAATHRFEIVEVDVDKVIARAPEAVEGTLMCWLCFDGHTWPCLRPHVVNIPPEMRFNRELPWARPTWVSTGREDRSRGSDRQST